MEPQGRGSVSPLRTRRRNRALGLRKTTLRSRVHVQTVGLNAETKKDRHRAGRGGFSLDIPFYRTCPNARSGNPGVFWRTLGARACGLLLGIAATLAYSRLTCV